MGYTHYWTFKKIKRGQTKQVEAAYQRAIEACAKIVHGYNAELKKIDAKHPDRLSGFTAHCKPGQYRGIDFNGTQDLGHENFVLRERYKQNFEDHVSGFNFCKTAQKPYDAVVVACLIVLKDILGSQIDVSSDGYKADWTQGLLLARLYYRKNVNIPDSIEGSHLRAV